MPVKEQPNRAISLIFVNKKISSGIVPIRSSLYVKSSVDNDVSNPISVGIEFCNDP